MKNQQNLKSIKILCQVNQEILKPLKVIIAAGKLSLRYAYSLRGFYAGILQVCQSRGHSAKNFTNYLRDILFESSFNYYSDIFSYKFSFIPILFFRRNQRQEPSFQVVGDLVAKNTSVIFL